MITPFAIIFFVFGLIVGSFLNVVILRFNTKRSLGGRSACMSCQNRLNFLELIPLVSFFVLLGRCRNCKTKISIQYPIVEFATGMIFVALFLKFSYMFWFFSPAVFILTWTYCAFMFSILLVITAYDLKHKIIPDKLSLLFGVLAFISLFFFGSNLVNFHFYPHIPSILSFFSGPLIAFPFFLFWFVSSGKWMGFGDVKLALGLGWFLGFLLGLSALVLAFFIGAIVGIFLIISRKGYGMKSEIPFAPYLVFGTFLVFIFELYFF